MTYLLDTNVISDLVRGNQTIEQRIGKLAGAGSEIVICPIVRSELIFGIRRLADGKKRDDLRDSTMKLLAGFRCDPIPEAAGDEYARIKRVRQQAGLPMNENDLWIAAAALALGAVIVTRDNDFENVDGLVVEDWTA